MMHFFPLLWHQGKIHLYQSHDVFCQFQQCCLSFVVIIFIVVILVTLVIVCNCCCHCHQHHPNDVMKETQEKCLSINSFFCKNNNIMLSKNIKNSIGHQPHIPTYTQIGVTGTADHLTFLRLFYFFDLLSILSLLLLPKCPSDLLHHCPWPPACD